MTDDAVDRVFAALADSSRRAILTRLLDGPKPMTSVGEGLSFTRQAAAKHVRTLADAGLVRVTRVGREQRVEIDLRPLLAAEEWIRRLEVGWDEALMRLKLTLELGDETP